MLPFSKLAEKSCQSQMFDILHMEAFRELLNFQDQVSSNKQPTLKDKWNKEKTVNIKSQI